MSPVERKKSGALRIEECAADWLARKKEFGAWTDEDGAAFDLWLRQSPAHLIAYTRLEEAWKHADRLHVLRESVPQKSSLGRPRIPFLRMAAAVAVLGLAGIVWAGVRSHPPGVRTFTTPIGGHQLLTLSDGTKMELNTNTVLRVALSDHERTVWLDKGEAYFHVTHNADRPFVIYTGGRRITDLGTKFLVRNDAGKLEVALLEGRVRLDAATTEQQAMTVLTPGDDAIAAGDITSVTKEPMRDMWAKLGWQRGVIVFDHTTLADAAAEFNRYNTVKIAISDPSVAAITIDGTFPTNGVVAFVQAARDTFKLHAKQTSSEIVISR